MRLVLPVSKQRSVLVSRVFSGARKIIEAISSFVIAREQDIGVENVQRYLRCDFRKNEIQVIRRDTQKSKVLDEQIDYDV